MRGQGTHAASCAIVRLLVPRTRTTQQSTGSPLVQAKNGMLLGVRPQLQIRLRRPALRRDARSAPETDIGNHRLYRLRSPNKNPVVTICVRCFYCLWPETIWTAKWASELPWQTHRRPLGQSMAASMAEQSPMCRYDYYVHSHIVMAGKCVHGAGILYTCNASLPQPISTSWF